MCGQYVDPLYEIVYNEEIEESLQSNYKLCHLRAASDSVSTVFIGETAKQASEYAVCLMDVYDCDGVLCVQ